MWSTEKKTDKLVVTSRHGDIEGLAWSRDGHWLSYDTNAANGFSQSVSPQPGGRDDHGGDERPLRQLQRHLEPRRGVVVLPVRPRPPHRRAIAVGPPPAGPVHHQPDGDLRPIAEEGRTVPVRPARRASRRRGCEGGKEGQRQEGTRGEVGDRGARGDRVAALQGAGAFRAPERPADRRSPALLALERDELRAEAKARRAAHRAREAAAEGGHGGRARIPGVGRRQEAPRAQGAGQRERPLRLRCRRQGAGQARRGEGGAWELDVLVRPARAMAPDVRGGLAARARLLLRPRHARDRLAQDSRQVSAARRAGEEPRRARTISSARW